MACYSNSPILLEFIKPFSACCICLHTGRVINVSNQRIIQKALGNDFSQYIGLDNTSFLCIQCCLMMQMCCNIEDCDRGMDLFDVYYRSQFVGIPENYESSFSGRKRKRTLDISKFEAVKRRLFEDEADQSTELESNCSSEGEELFTLSDVSECSSVIVDGEVELPENDGVLPDYYVDSCSAMS